MKQALDGRHLSGHVLAVLHDADKVRRDGQAVADDDRAVLGDVLAERGDDDRGEARQKRHEGADDREAELHPLVQPERVPLNLDVVL